MKSISRLTMPTIFILMITFFLMACASAPVDRAAPAADSGGDSAQLAVEESMSDGAGFEADEAADSNAARADFDSQAAADGQPMQNTALQNRKIIREATIQLEAKDVATALNQATVLSVRVGGYTIGSNSWQEAEDRQYASLSFAVPVERFEEALEQTRRLGKVTSENSTSQDVTAQYVDIEARINNLEVTAERIRGFLVEATDLKYILEVNRELSRVEGDLESLKGQRNALAQRTSFSKIHLDITPPPVVPTTTEVIETVAVWSPTETFNSALAILLNVLKAGADMAIWLAVVGLPVVLVLWVVWFVLWRLIFGRVRRVAQAPSEAGA